MCSCVFGNLLWFLDCSAVRLYLAEAAGSVWYDMRTLLDIFFLYFVPFFPRLRAISDRSKGFLYLLDKIGIISTTTPRGRYRRFYQYYLVLLHRPQKPKVVSSRRCLEPPTRKDKYVAAVTTAIVSIFIINSIVIVCSGNPWIYVYEAKATARRWRCCRRQTYH